MGERWERWRVIRWQTSSDRDHGRKANGAQNQQIMHTASNANNSNNDKENGRCRREVGGSSRCGSGGISRWLGISSRLVLLRFTLGRPQGKLLLSLERMSDWTGWVALGASAESRVHANMGVAWRCPRVSLRKREGERAGGREGGRERMTPNERERRAFARRSRQAVVRWRMGCRRWYQKKPEGVKKGPIRYCSPGVLGICKDVRGG